MRVLSIELMKEKLDLVFDSFIFIFQVHADVNNLTFKFQHVIQYEMSNDHKSLSSDVILFIMEQHEDVLSLLIQNIGEAIEEITY